MSRRWSLWLVPGARAEASTVLENWVKEASAMAQTPPFSPHITLYSVAANDSNQKAVSQELEKYAKKLHAFPVTLADLGSQPAKVYQCVYALLEPKGGIMQARQLAIIDLAKVAHSENDNSFYMPHVSLVYDPTSKMSGPDRVSFIQQFKTKYSCFQPGTPTATYSYDVSRLLVVDTTDDNYHKWTTVHDFILHKSHPHAAVGSGASEEKHKQSKDDHSKQDTSAHNDFIRRANTLAKQAVGNGNLPFGALLVVDGKIILEAENTSIKPVYDVTRQAEINLISAACQKFGPKSEVFGKAIIYSSCEPDPMSSGAIYWSGIRTVVYSTSEAARKKHAGDSISDDCRVVLYSGTHEVKVIGPVLEEEGEQIHKSFWSSTRSK